MLKPVFLCSLIVFGQIYGVSRSGSLYVSVLPRTRAESVTLSSTNVMDFTAFYGIITKEFTGN